MRTLDERIGMLEIGWIGCNSDIRPRTSGLATSDNKLATTHLPEQSIDDQVIIHASNNVLKLGLIMR